MSFKSHAIEQNMKTIRNELVAQCTNGMAWKGMGVTWTWLYMLDT